MTKRKAEPHIDHEIATVASFRRNPDFAAEYLNAVLEDGDREELLLALRRIAESFGGVSKLAEDADLNVTALYRTLSARGNPELKSLMALLKAMGMRLAVHPIASKKASPQARLGIRPVRPTPIGSIKL